jgi:hypothetical protein
MTYREMMTFLDSLVEKRSDILSIKFCGESVLGYKIPVVYFENKIKNSKVKIWMQGGLHGNEPAGTESILMFIEYLVNSKNIDSVLNNVSFAFIPMANIDGYEKQSRDNSKQADLNRDQVTLKQPESVSIKKAFTDFSPAVAADFHEYRPFRKELDGFANEKLCISQDVLFLPSGNLNVPARLRKLTNELYLQNVKEELKKQQITFDNYFVPDSKAGGINFLRMGGDSPRSSATSFGLTNSISILFEIRGIALERNSYKRRVNTGFLIARSILETTLNNKNKVINTIDRSINETIKAKKPIILKSDPNIYQGNMTFINPENLKLIQLKVQIEDAGNSKAVSARKRPKTYLLLAENFEIAEKLNILGVEIDTLKNDMELKAEVLKMDLYTSNSESVKGPVFILSKQIKLFPKGSFVISMEQKNANVVISTLEPEMECGYFSYKMIVSKSDGEIPVYRCMTEINQKNRSSKHLFFKK